MDAAAPPLDDLRAEIDEIDQAIVELLVRRTAIVRRIGEVKDDRRSGRLAVRPAREAEILRRLIAAAGDRFPHDVLVRMWRELVAAQTRLQTPLSVSVYAPRDSWQSWDLARDHFGSLTPMVRVDSASQAIRAAGDGSTTVAVVPLPGDDDPWWPSLISDHYDRLRVFARLPFITSGAGEGEEPSALALGRIEPEPSGDDLSLLAIEAEGGVSRGRLRDLLTTAGLAPTWLAAWRPPREEQAFHLIETPSLVVDGDPRIPEVLSRARAEVLRIVSLGGYPRPLRTNAAL